MRKKYTILFFVISVCLIFCGCDNKKKSNKDGDIIISMWHNYGGEMQESVDNLIDEFNSTVGKEKGIVINVTAISSSSELNESLNQIVHEEPGAPDMPDICTAYPNVAIDFQKKDLLVNFNEYMGEDFLSEYVPSFIEEGRFSDGLYVFPIAKSTEVLYVNQTLFDRFAEKTGASEDDLTTFEGISKLAKEYYKWSDGKAFFAADSWFNVFQVGEKQLNGNFINDNNKLDLSSDKFLKIFDIIYNPSSQGSFAMYDGYSSDLSKTGDLVCSTGSSAGILFYGDTITYSDGTEEKVKYSILPYPVFENAEKKAIQRGGGIMVAKSDEEKEKAAIEFIEWFTAAEQNMRFVSSTGYLPVTKKAFEEDMPEHINSVEDERIKKMLATVTKMYNEYEFFTAPTFEKFSELSDSFEAGFIENMKEEQQLIKNGEDSSKDKVLEKLDK